MKSIRLTSAQTTLYANDEDFREILQESAQLEAELHETTVEVSDVDGFVLDVFESSGAR